MSETAPGPVLARVGGPGTTLGLQCMIGNRWRTVTGRSCLVAQHLPICPLRAVYGRLRRSRAGPEWPMPNIVAAWPISMPALPHLLT